MSKLHADVKLKSSPRLNAPRLPVAAWHSMTLCYFGEMDDDEHNETGTMTPEERHRWRARRARSREGIEGRGPMASTLGELRS